MHGISVHSALAIKRQRKRRADAERSKRRNNRRGSVTTLQEYLENERDGARTANKVIGTVTMLHIGGIFTLIGLLLLLAAVLTTQVPSEMAELIGTGVICLLIGIFLIALNWIYGKREEEDLTHYVEARLARTTSGQRLFHESESQDRLQNKAKNPSQQPPSNAQAHAQV